MMYILQHPELDLNYNFDTWLNQEREGHSVPCEKGEAQITRPKGQSTKAEGNHFVD